MPIFVDSLHDPRLAPYANLKDRDLAREGNRFIAEGEQVVRRLFDSTLQTESVLLAERKAEAICPIVPLGTEIFIAPDRVITQVLGFRFHSGVMACGVRPPSPMLDELLGPPQLPPKDRKTLVICPNTNNSDNLGSLIRISAAFGVDGMILGEKCCDPYFRHSVRVSMGTVFKQPMTRSSDVASDLKRLQNEWGFELVATVLSAAAEPLADATRRTNTAILFGGERDGLNESIIAACDRRISIPMRRQTDSLNVAVAAGIFLYHFVDMV